MSLSGGPQPVSLKPPKDLAALVACLTDMHTRLNNPVTAADEMKKLFARYKESSLQDLIIDGMKQKRKAGDQPDGDDGFDEMLALKELLDQTRPEIILALGNKVNVAEILKAIPGFVENLYCYDDPAAGPYVKFRALLFAGEFVPALLKKDNELGFVLLEKCWRGDKQVPYQQDNYLAEFVNHVFDIILPAVFPAGRKIASPDISAQRFLLEINFLQLAYAYYNYFNTDAFPDYDAPEEFQDRFDWMLESGYIQLETEQFQRYMLDLLKNNYNAELDAQNPIWLALKTAWLNPANYSENSTLPASLAATLEQMLSPQAVANNIGLLTANSSSGLMASSNANNGGGKQGATEKNDGEKDVATVFSGMTLGGKGEK